MATYCPQCSAPGLFAAETVGEAGRFVRCVRCGTVWLARRFANDVYGRPEGRALAVAARPRTIIEGEVIEAAPLRARQHRTTPPPPPASKGPGRTLRFDDPPPPRTSNRRLAALGLVLTVIVIVGLAIPIIAAIPGFAGLFQADNGGLVIENVASAALQRGGVDTIIVQGTVVNRGRSAAPVPALRISLRTNQGGEAYSWDVQPAKLVLGPDESVSFRSALANPAPDAEQVAVDFAGPKPLAVSMR
ncbi:MAG TPA: zinc-ribbon domain-containing protein [Bauldia sp.]|nr:zinc-ribbon domain-containing protein [Bauldia sp.]